MGQVGKRKPLDRGRRHYDRNMLNDELRRDLLAMVEQDHAFIASPRDREDAFERDRLELLAQLRGRLVEILGEYGWPGRSLVGEDGAEAAWMLAMHTMPDPDVLRLCLALMREAAAVDEADPSQLPYLEDRHSLIERGVQIYGTVICRLEDGTFGAPQLDDPEHVDDRRRAVDLMPLDEDIARIAEYHRRAEAEASPTAYRHPFDLA